MENIINNSFQFIGRESISSFNFTRFITIEDVIYCIISLTINISYYRCIRPIFNVYQYTAPLINIALANGVDSDFTTQFSRINNDGV